MYKCLLVEDYWELSDKSYEMLEIILPPDRKYRVRRLQKRKDRCAQLVSWAMLNHLLLQEFGIKEWKEIRTPSGKPFLQDYPDIHYNISHCPEGCLCAVADMPIGVDIQDVRPFQWNIANRVCCEKEIEALKQTKRPELLFTKMWAMKESILKMEGVGLAYGPENVNTLDYRQYIELEYRKNYVIAVACYDRLGGK